METKVKKLEEKTDLQDGKEAENPPRTCILVLGMHRSGTSAITRVLNFMGAALPQNILGANEGNETGHWEPENLLELHDELLSELDSSWDDWQAIDLNKLSDDRYLNYKKRLQTLIKQEYKYAKLFVLKDPRICLLLPFYSELLEEINVEIKIVAQFRNPLDVMDSLQTRDEMLSSDAALLWLQYVLCSEKSSRNFERVFVKYDEVLKEWKTCHQTIANSLDVDWLYTLEEIENQVDQFISPKHCHHSHKDEEVLFDPLLRQWVGETYAALLVLQKSPNSENAQKKLDEIAEQFETASPMLVQIKKSLRHFYKQQISEGEQQIAQKDNVIAEMEQQIAQNNDVITEKQQKIAQKDNVIAEKQQQIAKQDDVIAEREQLLIEKDQILIDQQNLFTSSTSWKVTRPLRIIKTAIRKVRNRLNENEHLRIIVSSRLFDEKWYLAKNPDVKAAKISGAQHFLRYGASEGREPSEFFDLNWYLSKYPDVKNSEMNPLLHYITYGAMEYRLPKAPSNLETHTPNTVNDGIQLSNNNSKNLKTENSLASRVIKKIKHFNVSEIEMRVNNLNKFINYPTQTHELKKLTFSRKKMDITWIIPDFKVGAGGHMTIFRIAHYLEKFGHKITFYIQNPTEHKNGQKAKETINQHFQKFEGNVELLQDPLPTLFGDALIATDRFTCFPVQAMSGFKKKFYFVQDYEPLFYPMGTEALLSENTYKMDLNCLCAGEWLDNLMKERFGLWSKSWPLAYDASQYFPKPDISRSSNRIAFYSRYVTPRRAVELGFMSLDILHKRGVDFEVDFFGWDLGQLNVEYPYIDHGVMCASELANLYCKATVGVVFSATNHSLVNKEMMACGLPVVDLDIENVRAIFPSDCMVFAQPDPEAIADKLQNLLEDSQKQNQLRNSAYNWINEFSWEKSARIVEAAIIEKLSDTYQDEEK